MSDLIERLRYEAECDIGPYGTTPPLLHEAADEIERLRAVLEDAEQRVKDVQWVCDHNQAQIKRQFAELKQANAALEAAFSDGFREAY